MGARLSEAQLHRAVASYLHAALKPPAFFTTFPAGGGGRVRGAQLKAMGLMAGMPDLLVVWEADGVHLLGIELKAKKGTQSRAQVECAAKFAAAGALYSVCRSVDDVEWILGLEGVPTRIRPRMAA